LFTLCLAGVKISAQELNKEFEVLGVDPSGIVYLIHKDIVREGVNVKFAGVEILDEKNFRITVFDANCDTREYSELVYKGLNKGTPVEITVEKPVKKKATKDMIIWKALDFVCGRVDKSIGV
jgi:hypothetical protein